MPGHLNETDVAGVQDSNAASVDVLETYDDVQIYLPAHAFAVTPRHRQMQDGDDVIRVPAETAAALFCLRYAGVPTSWVRLVVVPLYVEDGADAVPGVVPVRRGALPVLDAAAVPGPVSACRLPAAWLPSRRQCVAGLCAVVRCAVRTRDRLLRPDASHYDGRDTGLLGFRRGTLAPPAEVSLWTRFCERDAPAALHRALTSADVPTVVPSELARFERHLQQPLRVHNVWKQEQRAAAAAGSNKDGGRPAVAGGWRTGDHVTGLRHVRHVFAEGHVLTIADLLLYPCFYLLLVALRCRGVDAEPDVPIMDAWMRRLEALDGFCEARDAVFHLIFISLLFNDPTSMFIGRKFLSLPELAPGAPELESLYRKDPLNKKRHFAPQSEVDEALSCLERSAEDGVDFSSAAAQLVVPHPGLGQLQLDWAALPAGADPADGGLPASRLLRKRQQLENMVWLAQRVARPGHVLVDFCSGGGHLGLLLAVLLPQCQVILLENKEESMRRAQQRAAELQLPNVTLYQCNMDAFRGRFDVGLALHACGLATDLVVTHCMRSAAACIVCPCCYGAVREYGTVRYPRSEAAGRTAVTQRQWLALAHCADRTHADGSVKSEQGRRCMRLVDADRALHARETGRYRTLLTVAQPADCSDKNHLLVAIPPDWPHNDIC